jgi:hypothetical protein
LASSFQALFGFDDVTDDSDEDEKGPSKKRSKNGLGEPIFTNDVTGAPTPKADVSTPPKDGPVPQVKEEAEAEVGATGTAEVVGNGDTVAAELKGQDVVDLKGGITEADMKAHSNGLPAKVEEMGKKGTVKEQGRASKYWPELEDVVYNVRPPVELLVGVHVRFWTAANGHVSAWHRRLMIDSCRLATRQLSLAAPITN